MMRMVVVDVVVVVVVVVVAMKTENCGCRQGCRRRAFVVLVDVCFWLMGED